jgi:hypothetical protein
LASSLLDLSPNVMKFISRMSIAHTYCLSFRSLSLSIFKKQVTAQDARPEALCVSGDTERIYQDFRFLGDGLDDVPALLFGSGDE